MTFTRSLKQVYRAQLDTYCINLRHSDLGDEIAIVKQQTEADVAKLIVDSLGNAER
ncbi:hypothetical protein ACIPUD_14830 [Bradyrhizobium sp. CAR08]